MEECLIFVDTIRCVPDSMRKNALKEKRMSKTEQYLVDYIRAWMITDLKHCTQEILDNEIVEITAGEHSEDCKHTIAIWEAKQ